MNPEEIVKVTELVQVLRDEVAQLKKFLNPIEHCGGTTTKGAPCRNRCVPGTKFCKKHTVGSKKVVPVSEPEPEIENADSDFEKKLTALIQSENKTFDWADSDIDDDCLPELGKEFVV
jgi:hypothetical protein|tara:strand:+ start:2645 stop:2998 length:354 start_codon:yes stop_codon:yes gene_type:complete